MNKNTKIIWKAIDELIPYEHNAKEHNETQIKNLATSLKKYGWQNPVLIDKNNIIIAGHGRVLGAKELGLTEAPCIYANDLTEEQVREYRILDNKLTESAWIDEELEFELPELDFSDFDLEFDVDFGEEEKSIIEDEVPEVDEETEPICKLGDIWQLGEHRLICGDSTDKAVIDRLMDGVKADCVFTDPPYGIGIDGQKESKCANPKHNRKAHEFRGWDNTRPDKSVFDYILSLNIPSVIFGGNYFADMLPATRGWIYWSKGQDGLTMSDGELAWTNVNKPLRCVTVNRANLGKTVHPTQKPLKVVEFCLDYAGEGKVVLDLFGGSGSTLIACEQLNRKCYMCELDPKYCDVIIQRWENFTGQKAVKVSN